MYPNLPPILLYISFVQPPYGNYPINIPFQYGIPIMSFPQIPSTGYSVGFNPYILGVPLPSNGNFNEPNRQKPGRNHPTKGTMPIVPTATNMKPRAGITEVLRGPKESEDDSPKLGARSMSLALKNQGISRPMVEMKLDHNGEEMKQNFELPSINQLGQYTPMESQNQQAHQLYYYQNQNFHPQMFSLSNVVDNYSPFSGARSMSLGVQNPGNSQPEVEMKLEHNGEEMVQKFKLPSIDLYNSQMFRPNDNPTNQIYYPNQNFNQHNIPSLDVLHKNVPLSGARSMNLALKNQGNSPPEIEMSLEHNGHLMTQNLELPSTDQFGSSTPVVQQSSPQYPQNLKFNQLEYPNQNFAEKNSPLSGARSMGLALKNPGNSPPEVEMKLGNNGREMIQSFKLPSTDLYNQFRPSTLENQESNQQRVQNLEFKQPQYQKSNQQQPQLQNFNQQGGSSSDVPNQNSPVSGARSMSLALKNPGNSPPDVEIKLDHNGHEMIQTFKLPSTELYNQSGPSPLENQESNQQQLQNLEFNQPEYQNQKSNQQQQPPEIQNFNQQDSSSDVPDQNSPVSGARSMSLALKNPGNSPPKVQMKLPSTDLSNQFEPSTIEHEDLAKQENQNQEFNQEQPQNQSLKEQGGSSSDVADKNSPLSGARSMSLETKNPENSEHEVEMKLPLTDMSNQQQLTNQEVISPDMQEGEDINTIPNESISQVAPEAINSGTSNEENPNKENEMQQIEQVYIEKPRDLYPSMNTSNVGTENRPRTATIQFASQLQVHSYNKTGPKTPRLDKYNQPQNVFNQRKGNYPVKQYANNQASKLSKNGGNPGIGRRQETRAKISKQKLPQNNIASVDDKVDSFQLALMTILDKEPRNQGNNKEKETNFGQVPKDSKTGRRQEGRAMKQRQNNVSGVKVKEDAPVQYTVDPFKIALMTILQQKEKEEKTASTATLNKLLDKDPEKFKYALHHLLSF